VSFLSIAFLTALPLAAVPILLHLFDRRRNVVIEWGAMHFLMEAAVRRTSARKLKQWLLVLMRVAILLFLILALSRPMMPGSWLGSRHRGETIIVLDNSLSMERREGETSRFDQAIVSIEELLGELSDGESVRVLLASPYPIWATAGGLRAESGARDRIVEQLRELEPTGTGSDLLAALLTAVQAEHEPTLTDRRIVLLTDGQGSDWNFGDDDGWRRFREAVRSAPLATGLEVIELADDSSRWRNLSVQEIRGSRLVVGVDQTLTLTARVVNHGGTASSPATAAWSIGGKTRLESEVPALDGGRIHDVYWQHSFSEPGSYSVTCRLDAEDDLLADNAATTIIEVVERIPVLIAESNPELAEMQRDAFFVQAALGWVDDQALDERGVHVPRTINPENLSHVELGDQHAVVIPNLQSLSFEAVERLRQFVREGGGLWIALGPRTDAEQFNRYFFAEGNGLAPLELDRISEQSNAEDDSSGMRINPFQREHPATAHLTDSQKLDTGDVRVNRRWRFVPPPEGEDVSVLLSLTDGEPLAVEKYFGRGRVIVQSIPLRMQWSDLARSQAFVVMAREWISYLTQPRAVRHNLAPGEPILVELPDQGVRNAILNTPQGDEVELTADVRGDRIVFQSGRTALPGDYALEIGTSGEVIPFHVRGDPAESDLTSLAQDERDLLAELTGIPSNRSGSGFRGETRTEPIWHVLLMLLIGLIAGELILSGIIARERFGSDPIAESSESSGSTVAAEPVSSASVTRSAPGRRPAEPINTG
jgi:hypothetical protein